MVEEDTIDIDKSNAKISNITMPERNFITKLDTLTDDYYSILFEVFILLFMGNKEEHHDKSLLKTYFEELLDGAWTVKQWAENNNNLDRFPANIDELGEAYRIIVRSTLKCLAVREKYQELVDTENLFSGIPNQTSELLNAAKLLRAISRSVDDAKRAIDPDTLVINQAILMPVE